MSGFYTKEGREKERKGGRKRGREEASHKPSYRTHKKLIFSWEQKWLKTWVFSRDLYKYKATKIHKAEVSGIILLPEVFSKITKCSKIL